MAIMNSATVPGEFQEQRGHGGLQSMESQRGGHDWATNTHTPLHKAATDCRHHGSSTVKAGLGLPLEGWEEPDQTRKEQNFTRARGSKQLCPWDIPGDPVVKTLHFHCRGQVL